MSGNKELMLKVSKEDIDDAIYHGCGVGLHFGEIEQAKQDAEAEIQKRIDKAVEEERKRIVDCLYEIFEVDNPGCGMSTSRFNEITQQLTERSK